MRHADENCVAIHSAIANAAPQAASATVTTARRENVCPKKPLMAAPVSGNDRNQPEMEVLSHNLSKFTWSTFNVSRVR